MHDYEIYRLWLASCEMESSPSACADRTSCKYAMTGHESLTCQCFWSSRSRLLHAMSMPLHSDFHCRARIWYIWIRRVVILTFAD